MEHPPRPLRTALQLLLPPAAVLLLIALVLAAAAGGCAWLLRSEEGTRWVAAHLPGALRVEGTKGTLLGPHFEAACVVVTWGEGTHRVTITGLRGDGLHWRWRPSATAWLGLAIDHLAAQTVDVSNHGPPGPPPTVPKSLGMPVQVSSDDVRVAELTIVGLPAFKAVSGRAAVGDARGYHLEGLDFDWLRMHLRGSATLGSARPFALTADLDASAPPLGTDSAFDTSFQAALQARGSLERIELGARLQGRPRAGHAAPTANVQATVLSFAAWPLAELKGQTEALDLASLLDAAPETRLSGQVQVSTSGSHAPVGAHIVFDNALAGRWDQHRLPLRRIALDLLANPARRDELDLKAFDIALASGRWQGQGRWLGDALEVSSQLADLQPQQLDARAAAMTLSGPLAFTLRGLPSPDAHAQAPRPPLSIELRSTLDGRLAARPLPVHVQLQAKADAGHVEIGQLLAQSGGASAQLLLSARSTGGGAWQVASSGSLNDFDPVPWWPGEVDSAWRQGRERLSADWKLDLRVPAGAAALAPPALAQRLAGSGTLHLHDSLLAGLPFALDLDLAQSASGAGAPSRLHGTLELAGNQAVFEAQGDPAGRGDDDRLQFELKAPALAALAPLVRMVPRLTAWAPGAGSAQASASAQGRWPRIRSSGQARLDHVEAGDFAVAEADAHWQLDLASGTEAPLDLHAEASALRLGRQRAQLLRADLRGTLRQHRIVISGALPLVPPPLAEQLFGVNALSGTRARLEGDGSWQPAAGGGGSWSGHIARLAIGAWDGGALAAQSSRGEAGWIDASNLSAELRFDADGDLAEVKAAPGQVRLADAVTLKWDAVELDLTHAAPNIDLQAEIEPFALAPLLARAQPTMGWHGDLTLAATVKVHAAERFDADIVFERRAGDLALRDDAGSEALGLSDLRIGLAAHDGSWIFTQAFAGRALGEMAGAIRARTTPQARWPGPDSPLDGVVSARVADIGIWSTWVPAGWRLVGTVSTSATLGGRFGAPEYTGRVVGSDLGVRSLLQGVNISKGQIAIQLEGAAAKITLFELQSGEGKLQVTGGAEFGSSPSARLHLAAEHFRVLGRIDRQLIASGAADLELRTTGIALNGHVSVDEGLFDATHSDAPALDDDVTVVEPGTEESSAGAAAAPHPRRNVAVTVDVDLGQKLRVRGHGLDTALRGQLHITTPGGKLSVQGTVHTEGGTYAAYGQKLAIEHGAIAFTGAVDNPRLDILALRSDIDTKVGVSVTGNLLTVRARLYSDPDMADTDKLSWLLLGRAPDGLGRSDTAMLQSAAVALLSGENGAPTDALMRRLGLDELTVRQSDTDVQQTVISVGKQLTRRWYVGYERGVNATAGTFQLIYRIAQRITVRAQSGAENSLDVIWSWRFGEAPREPVPKSPAAPP